jgi:diguanylate cyclase (GGDEF)-like protein
MATGTEDRAEDRRAESTDSATDSNPGPERTVTDSGSAGDSGEPDGPLAASVILIAHPDGHLLGTRFDLSPGTSLTVGRSPDADISLPEVRSLSRMHARVEHRGSSVVVEDLGSTNGTLVNDQRIAAATPLASGGRFQVGGCHFKLLQDRDVERAYHDAIHALVTHDGLTDAVSRTKFDEEFEREFSRAQRYDRQLSLVLMDIDHFKRVNDTHGHLCGDSVLKALVARVQPRVRAEQVFARVGGEEFAILCPETGVPNVRILAERLRLDIGGEPFRCGDADVVVTCSFGIAGLSEATTRPEELFEAADRALYVAKNSGRDKVAVYEPPV